MTLEELQRSCYEACNVSNELRANLEKEGNHLPRDIELVVMNQNLISLNKTLSYIAMILSRIEGK